MKSNDSVSRDSIEIKLQSLMSKFSKEDQGPQERTNSLTIQDNNSNRYKNYEAEDKKQKMLNNPKFSNLMQIIEPDSANSNKTNSNNNYKSNHSNYKVEIKNLISPTLSPGLSFDYKQSPNNNENHNQNNLAKNKIKTLTEELNSLIFSSPKSNECNKRGYKTSINNNINFFDLKCNLNDNFKKKDAIKRNSIEYALLYNNAGEKNNKINFKLKIDNFSKNLSPNEFYTKPEFKSKLLPDKKIHENSSLKFMMSPMMREQVKREFYHNRKTQIVNLMNAAKGIPINNPPQQKQYERDSFWEAPKTKFDNLIQTCKKDRSYANSNTIINNNSRIYNNVNYSYREHLDKLSDKLFGSNQVKVNDFINFNTRESNQVSSRPVFTHSDTNSHNVLGTKSSHRMFTCVTENDSIYCGTNMYQ